MRHAKNRTIVPFDTVVQVGTNELVFSISATGEQLGWVFDGAGHYLTANCTLTRGFDRGDGKSVYFQLTGTAPNTLRGIGLNYMVYDFTGEGDPAPSGVLLQYESPWVNSTWVVPARFGVYERVDEDTEDDTLFDFWVDEGLPHPRLQGGVWDRQTAQEWLKGWINATFDMSNFGMVPRNLSEWREFIPWAKKADAKVLWFNFRVWDWTSIDNVNPHMFPNGVKDLKQFSDDAAQQGLRLSTHRMSGGLDPRDPDYCVKPSPGLLAWGNMTLTHPASPSDTTIIVTPSPGLTIPANYHGLSSCNIGGDEYIISNTITRMSDGDWTLHLANGIGLNHSSGSIVRCFVKGNVYYLPDLFSPLYEEVAVRYANFSNLIGFQDGSFDGAAWFAWYGRWGFYKFASLVYQNLDHPTAVHTSGVLVSPAWMEYRFNAARRAYNGNFSTYQSAVPMEPGYPGHATASVEEVTNKLFVSLVGNSRDFAVGHDLRSTLDAYNQVGNADDLLKLVREYKAGSLHMNHTQRQHMVAAAWFKEPRRNIKHVAKARWEVEGEVYRKWINAGTATYHSLSFPASSYVPARFYTTSGEKVPLVLPQELWGGFERAAISGRLLPSFNGSHAQNIDLLGLMKTGPTLNVDASNPNTQENWDEKRLRVFKVADASSPLDLKHHQGIGMMVEGDGSGGTLVVRLISGNVARDYAVPLDFKGERWVVVPAGQQGWSARNWGPVGKGAIVWVKMNYSMVTEVAVGVGYLPANTTSNVTISMLKALADIDTPLIDPWVTVGDQTMQTKGIKVPMYGMFTLDPNGIFSVYDPNWFKLATCSVGPFRPTNLTSFAMGSQAMNESKAWLEVGVSGGTETVPNPGYVPPT